MLKLREYQKDCLTAIAKAKEDAITRQLVSLPTGTGKTVIFCHLARKFKQVLVLAHRDELCQQAQDKFLMVNPEAEGKIGWVKAERNEVDKTIIIGSVQTITRPNRLEQLPHFDLIITDEAHHAVADSYLRIYDTILNGNLHVGFTATPNRADNEGLGKVFERVVFEKTIKEMIEGGWLCNLEGKRITTDVSLDNVHTAIGDFNKRELTAAINTANRNQLIVKSWLELANERKTLAFTVDIQHAHDLSETFTNHGIRASPISGKTPMDERHGLIEKFHSGDIQVLCNCNLLTEGFDAPSVDCILLARPTQSQGLYIQMVGRGTRPYPEKENCLILDVVDNTTRHELRQFADLGLEPEEEEEERPFGTAPTGEKDRFNDYGIGNKLYSEDANILGRMAKYDWNRLDSDTFKLYLGDGYIKIGLRRDKKGYYAYFKPGGEDLQFITSRDSKYNLSWAIGIAEDFAFEHTKGKTTLIDKNASWKNDTATWRQKQQLDDLGIDYDWDVTKGEAAKLIDIGYHQQNQKGGRA